MLLFRSALRQAAIQAVDWTVRELKKNHRIKGIDTDEFAVFVRMHLQWADNIGMDERVKVRNDMAMIPDRYDVLAVQEKFGELGKIIDLTYGNLADLKKNLLDNSNGDDLTRLTPHAARFLLKFADTVILCYTNMMAIRFADMLFKRLPGEVRHIHIV